MKITFLRHGHSNNSSSSHSLIFTRKELPDSDESTDFGWQYFTCSSREAKLNYILTCLRDCFARKIQFPCLYNLYDRSNKRWSRAIESAESAIKKIKEDLFEDYVAAYFGFSDFDVSGYVDHESVINFPLDRGGNKIHHEFARDFINEFVNGNWYVFGGNDNSDEGHPEPPTSNDASDFEEFKTLWSFLSDSGDHLCVKDPLTGEYVLSNTRGGTYNGSILKIKFQ
jgi:hypothetical protein